MLFSVLIANYNNSQYLITAINSVLQQTYTNWEIIVVDDASTDAFTDCMAVFANEPRIRTFHNTSNQGCGYTKGRCAKEASGEILGYLDPDDALAPNALELMVAAHRSHPECSLVSSTHYICDDQLQVKRIADYPKALPANTPYLLLGDGRVHHFVSFKKACYDKTGGLSPVYKKAVDQDLYYKMEETGELLYIDTPLYYYRLHAGSISNYHKRHDATLWHYAVIEEACLRRIKALKQQGGSPLLKLYKARYYKIKIFHSFRRKKYLSFLSNLLLFPFVGGMDNILSYAKKLPREGFALVRRSLAYDHEIK